MGLVDLRCAGMALTEFSKPRTVTENSKGCSLMGDEPGEQGVRAAQTTLLVLETIAFAEEPLGVTQIAARVGLSKGAIFRHLQGLVARGYIAQEPVSARYHLGVKASLIGRLAPPLNDLAGAADGPMREFRDATSITTVLTTPTAHGALVLSTSIASHKIEIGVRRGSELAFHSSAQGKVMLAFGPSPLLPRILREELAPLTPYTITDPEKLRAEVAAAAEQGYAVAPEEALLGINALAAPVFGLHDEFVAAVALVGSIQFLPRDPPQDLIDAAREMAQAISHNLGRGIVPWSRKAQAG